MGGQLESYGLTFKSSAGGGFFKDPSNNRIHFLGEPQGILGNPLPLDHPLNNPII